MRRLIQIFGFKLTLFEICKILIVILIFVFLLLQPILNILESRNRNAQNVAVRFLKNNQTLRSMVGEIRDINIVVFPDPGERSRKVAERLRMGESNIFKSDSNISPPIVKKVDSGNGFWRKGEIVGTNKNLEVEIYVNSYNCGEYYSYIECFQVSRARYNENGSNWEEIHLSWFEKMF